MKALLLPCLLATSTALAQWSTDPTAPLAVCNAANDQRFMTAIADADSGYYVFWSDLRDNQQKGDLHGQHLDSEGNALWTPNGELLVSHPVKSINQMDALLMPDGSVIVSYFTSSFNQYGDTVCAMRFDPDGTSLWADAVVLLVGQDYRDVQMVLSGDHAYAMAYDNGIQYGCRMQRVGLDGTVQFPVAGVLATGLFGPFTVQPDGAGGLIHTIRCGNGAGACLKAQRFDSLGTAVWPNYIDVADAQGLNYAFSTTLDANNAQTAVWEVAGDLRMSRVDTLGNMLWAPAVLNATDLPTYVQQKPAITTIGNELFIAWSDNRPPANNADLFVQKYDLNTGAELWATDGIPAIQFNTFTPEPGIVASDSGAVIVTFEGNPGGFSAMRVRNDGALAWPDPVTFGAPSFNPPAGDRTHLPDGNGGAVVFWNSSTRNIHGARVYRNGKLYNDVGIAETPVTRRITVHPNPCTDQLRVDLPTDQRVSTIECIDAAGRRSKVTLHGSSTIDTSALPQGAYMLRIVTHRATLLAHFIKN